MNDTNRTEIYENEKNTEGTATEFCQQCPNHCPVTNLKCGRGRRFFGVETGEGGNAQRQEDRHEHEGHGNVGHGYGHGEHGNEGPGHGQEGHGQEGHGRREGHGRQEHGYGGRYQERGSHMENFNPDSLYGLMRGCGHYLYHSSGQGMGNSQERILSILLEKGNMSQKELQEILGIQPGSISEILAKLEDKKLVFRQKDEDDKRRSILILTEKGKKATAETKKEEKEQQLFKCLTEEEQETLKHLLKKICNDWKEQ